MNQFSDNPYESPIVAELNEPKRPAPPRKPWPPFIAIFWLAAGPFICLAAFRWCGSRGWVVIEDDAIFVLFYVTSGALWLTAGARVIIWVTIYFTHQD